ncbi:DUF3514 domain-containing protein [Ehrlichia canis]|uniref:Uncharacterized protein n=1 Tax=Ehrlichia canis (strain Jake) TaxID=269484 RepID=A0ACA6AV34_EHRCJ|nr:DUF3514 domain-containing protein [Ehrlichia canis]AAZ68123.1 hypothetical protein Ecaj_0072 [Ehrlichia canis str. Jake]
MLVGIFIAGAAAWAIVVLCKSRKTGNKSNIDNVETSTSGAAATTSDGELSEELSSLDIASSKSRVLDREGGGGTSLEENVVKLSGKSSRKRNKKKSTLKESKNVVPDIDVSSDVNGISGANSEKEEGSSRTEEQAANLDAKYLRQGAEPKVRQRTSIKQTKAGEKTGALQSSVKSSSQKSTKTQDVESKTSDSTVECFAKVEDISNSGNTSTMSKDDVTVSVESVSSQHLRTRNTEGKISSHQVGQSSDVESTGDQHASKKKGKKKKKKTLSVLRGVSDETLDTVHHTSGAFESTAGVFNPASEDTEGSLEQEYLRQGAKPKMRQPVASRQTKGAKKTDIVQSDVQKDVSARSSDILSNVKQDLKSSFPKSFDRSNTKARSVESGERQGVPSESAVKFVTKTLAEADLRVKESEIRKSSQRGKAQGLHGVSSKPCGEGSIEVVDYREEKRRARVEDVQGFFGGYLKTSTGKERESRSLEDVTVVEYVRREGDCGVVSREDRKSEVDNGYLQQGAKPKICRSYSIKQRKDTDAIPSCVHREVESSEKLPGVSEGQKTQVLTSVEASTHMTIKSFIRKHTSHLSAKEYFQQMVKFRKTVEQFADMHFVYSANFMFNIFNIVGNRLVLKPEIQNSLLKVTNNINLCTFIIKFGIIKQMVGRLCNLVILKYFKYCASHYYDQSHMDAFLISLINLGFSDLKTISARVCNFLYCYSQELKDKAVFKVHSDSFYYDMLGMYIDIVNSRVQDTQLNDLIDLIKVSCIVQFGHMYHIIVQSKSITTESCTDKEIQALIFQERSVKHMLFYAVRFARICDNARMAFSHLYSPDEKRNPVCVTSGLAFPRNIIRPCREIINDIDHNVKNGTMHFGVFMSNIANYTTSLFLNSELEFLIRKDIETYRKVIAEQYLTMGSAAESSRTL